MPDDVKAAPVLDDSDFLTRHSSAFLRTRRTLWIRNASAA